MESQETDSSRGREKVDLEETPIKEMRYDHRKSLAWDNAFFTNPGVLDPEELLKGLNFEENNDHKYSTTKSFNENIARPSFAWDNAFLTDQGVLDAKELSLMNHGFTITDFPELPPDSSSIPVLISQGSSRFSVTSIEFDLFQDMKGGGDSLPNSTLIVNREMPRKLKLPLSTSNKDQSNSSATKKSKPLLPSRRQKTKVCLVSQPKLRPLTPKQVKPEKKIVASEIGKNKGKHKNHGFEEESGSKSIIRSSYSSGYGVQDLTKSSSGLRLPLPKIGFFDSEIEEKENREPNTEPTPNRRIPKSKIEISPPTNRSVLGQRKLSQRKTRK